MSAVGAEVVHCGLDVADLDRSLAFYELLGLQERRRATIPGDSDHVFLGAGGEELQITVRQGQSLPEGDKPGHVAIRISSMESTVTRLSQAGHALEREPFRTRADGPLLCFVRDPDGYRVELLED